MEKAGERKGPIPRLLAIKKSKHALKIRLDIECR